MPVEVLRVASVGGVTTSDEGVAADPSDGAVRSVTVKTCAGPDTTLPRHDQDPSRCTVVEQVAAEPEATRSAWPGVPRPWKRAVPVVMSPGSAMVGATGGVVVGGVVGVGWPNTGPVGLSDGSGVAPGRNPPDEPPSPSSFGAAARSTSPALVSGAAGLSDAVGASEAAGLSDAVGLSDAAVLSDAVGASAAVGAPAAVVTALAAGTGPRPTAPNPTTAPARTTAASTVAPASRSGAGRSGCVRGRRTGPSPPTAHSSTCSPGVFTVSIPRDLGARVNPPRGRSAPRGRTPSVRCVRLGNRP